MMDKHIYKFICALLGVCSIIIPGPIVPIISLIISIWMLVTKIKAAKESSEGFEMLMMDIVIIAVVLIISIGFTFFRIWIVADNMKYNYSNSSSQEVSTSDLAEMAIDTYKIGNLSQFTDSSNNLNAIKRGFRTFLQNELGFEDVRINNNNIICNIGTEQIIFTITKNDINFSINEKYP